MRFLLTLLIPSLVACHQGSHDFQCKRGDDGVLLCSFKVPDGTKTLELSDCFGDDCVAAQITVTKKSTASVDGDSSASIHTTDGIQLNLAEAKDHQASAATAGASSSTHHADTHDGSVLPKIPGNHEYPVKVADQTFHVPWSQYGVLVASALHQIHGRHDWDYGDWLITLAVAVRGNERDGLDPEKLDQVVQLLQAALRTFVALEHNGHGDAKVSMGNAYMTMAESYIYDSYNPQYSQALEHFELSNQLFKSALDENKVPIGMTRVDVEMNWADTLVRIAVLSIEEKMGADQMTELDLDSLAMGGIGAAGAQMGETTTRAEALLMDAIGVFRRQVAMPDATDHTKAVQRSTRLANALQNLASISMLVVTTTLEKSNALLEEAVTHYQWALELGLEDDPERINAVAGVAESLYSLADGYLQEGKYDQSKARYRDTMIWYQKHNIASPSMIQDVQFSDADASLEATEQALEDYNAMLYGGGEIPIPNDYYGGSSGGGGDPIYQPDELYEADLHATLGALRMARPNELHLAISHLANAIERYARDADTAGRALADAQLNLAMAYFQQEEYALSMEAHADALDVYQKVVGEGKNPLMDGLEDLLAHHGVDRKETTTTVSGAGDAATVADGTNKGGDGSDRLIDLGAYQASILNATAAAKNEL